MIIDPKKELFRWKVDAVPYFSEPTAFAVKIMAKKRFGCHWPNGYFTFENEGKNCCWYSEVNDVYKQGVRAYKKFYLDKNVTKKLRKTYEQDVGKLLFLGGKIDKINLKKLSNIDLVNLFQKFLKKYQLFWATGNMPELAAYGSGYLLENVVKKQYSVQVASILVRTLSLPKEDSFHLKEQIGLLKLGEQLWKEPVPRQFLLKRDVESLQKELSLNYPDLYKKFVSHQQKYFWILNGYYGVRTLDIRYFLNDLFQHLDVKTSPGDILKKIKIGKIKQQREKALVIKKYEPTKNLIRLGEIVGLTTAWQDERKAVSLIGGYWLDVFLNEFARRVDISKDDLKYLITPEIVNVIRGNRLILTKISSRKRCCALQFGDTFRMVEEQKAKKIIGLLERKKTAELAKVSVIKGMVVSAAEKIVKGKVRVLTSSEQTDKLKPDEILVAAMTSPEYIVAIKRAKAIITDEGGLTCHAAIVSRELDKTCIVSTKIATKVLKDGDIVEINTQKGIVKIIEKNNE